MVMFKEMRADRRSKSSPCGVSRRCFAAILKIILHGHYNLSRSDSNLQQWDENPVIEAVHVAIAFMACMSWLPSMILRVAVVPRVYEGKRTTAVFLVISCASDAIRLDELGCPCQEQVDRVAAWWPVNGRTRPSGTNTPCTVDYLPDIEMVEAKVRAQLQEVVRSSEGERSREKLWESG